MRPSGVVLKRLRELNGDNLKEAATKAGKSTGWLSEVENGRGNAKLSTEEFERLVKVFNGTSHRKKFSLWVLADTNSEIREKSNFDGPILKHLRIKSGHSLIQVACKIGKSKSYISNLESGRKPTSSVTRCELLKIYGYKESSFKNFTSADKRSMSVPAQYKLDVLMRSMSEAEQFQVLQFALSLKE